MPQEKTINGVRLSIDVGDITDQKIEAFVFYARPDLELGSGFGNAITMRGGMSIKKELDSIGTLAPCKAVITEAGLLKANRIIHANGPKFMEDDILGKLRDTMLNTLKEADQAGIKQIGFPAMGAGFYGIPVQDCAKIMLETITHYVTHEKTSIREIAIFLLDKRQYKPFEDEFLRLN